MAVTVDNGALTDYTVTSDTVTGEQVQVVKIMLGGAGTNGGFLASGTPLPVSGPLTDAQLRATAVPVSGTVTATGPLTDTQLRATAVPVSGPLTDTQLRATAVPVSGTVTATGPLTDTQLRATAVPVSGPLTDTQLRATAVPVSGTVTATGPLTDTQLRATAVPVSGPLTDTQLRATAVPVSGTVTATGPLTDTQLRATAVPVSGTVTATGPLTDTQLRATAVPVSGTVTATGPLTDTQLRATAVPVSGTVAITGIVPNTAATNLGKAEDAAHASGDTGVFALAVRTDTPATTSSGTGDYDALHTGAEGGLQVSQIATARTGMLRARIASAASTNATSVKASAGVIWGIHLFNNTAVKKFFKLHNSATAPTVGSTAVTETIIIPADGGVIMTNVGDEYSTGIAYSITNAVGDADATAVAANDVHGVLLYK